MNPLHQPAATGSQQQAWPGRQSQEGSSLASHHSRSASLIPHISGLEGGSVSARREVYRRSDLLLPHAHALEAGLAENLGLHEMAHPIEEVQVSSGGGRLGVGWGFYLTLQPFHLPPNLKEIVIPPPECGRRALAPTRSDCHSQR